MAKPWFTRTIASRIAGATPAVLSLPKFTAPLPSCSHCGTIPGEFATLRTQSHCAPQPVRVPLVASQPGCRETTDKEAVFFPEPALVQRVELWHGGLGQQCCPNCGPRFRERVPTL